MLIKQLSIFLENRKGRFTEVAKILGEAGINMSAFTVSENSDFGILRLIVSDTDKAQAYLEGKGLKMLQRGNWPTGTYAYFDGLECMGIIMETLEFDDERKAGDNLITKWYERRHD